jgi:hypothetical protein
MIGPWLISYWSTAARRLKLAGGEAEEAARELCKKGAARLF